ncbi:energy transducer TonB [Fibrella aestuarina]|uniref:Energy transducer TonB n=2 Tax=Fibrivirga algicola TaxID=2950420 RepID=A0ABX0QCR9_9BACT|nr:energy transducer TonB [Fibrivirga algicola]
MSKELVAAIEPCLRLMCHRNLITCALMVPVCMTFLALTTRPEPRTGSNTARPSAATSAPASLTEPASSYIGEVFTVVEQNPEFPGGEAGMKTFISTNLRYPEEARKQQIEGDVYVHYIVTKDGSIVQPKIIKGIGAGCDEEALRLVKAMPRYKPGAQSGTLVAVAYNQRIEFRLDGRTD